LKAFAARKSVGEDYPPIINILAAEEAAMKR
jgi:hypothetical protein